MKITINSIILIRVDRKKWSVLSVGRVGISTQILTFCSSVGRKAGTFFPLTAFFMSVDHSRDALMQRPYKVLVMAM